MLPAPIVIEVAPGVIGNLGRLLAEHRIAFGGRLAVAVGSGQGDTISAELDLPGADVIYASAGTHEAAVTLGQRLRLGHYEAVAGIGGGQTIDVTKFAAHMAGIPMAAVATSLSHDGICSPVSSLKHEAGTGSYGVVMPAAVFVDLDKVRQAPSALAIAGIGDVLANLSAIADWELAASRNVERIDGLAAAMARSAAQAVLYLPSGPRSDEMLTVLAESLILSGMAMAVAGSSRPCSGGDHEIMHAINELFPGTASHGELAGVGALFCTFLHGNSWQAEAISRCLARYGLPRVPVDLGLCEEDFARAVARAPATRPGRHTILEELSLTEPEIKKRVTEFVQTFSD